MNLRISLSSSRDVRTAVGSAATITGNVLAGPNPQSRLQNADSVAAGVRLLVHRRLANTDEWSTIGSCVTNSSGGFTYECPVVSAGEYEYILSSGKYLSDIVTQWVTDGTTQRVFDGMPNPIGRVPVVDRDINVFGNRLGYIGTSLMQHNDLATSAKVSHNARGWISWARVLSRDLFFSPIWSDLTVYEGWEPSGTPGTTRNYFGLNAGVSGQTSLQVFGRKEFLTDNVECDIVVIDAGTNDIATATTKEYIQQIREDLAMYYLAMGKRVILLPILARGVASWASGSESRKKAQWINYKTRRFCETNPGVYYFDWNSRWVDPASADGEPSSGFSPDGIHMNPKGGYAIGKAFAAFLARILPDVPRRVSSLDDKFDATYNPYGNILGAVALLPGTSGANGTGSSGSVATGMRVERTAGTSTVVCSKETAPDNRGERQVMTFTPAGSGENTFLFRTSTADTTHNLSAGDWIQASLDVDVSAYSGWTGITLYLKDQGTNGLIAYSMEPYDSGSGNEKLTTEAWSGRLTTPPIQLVEGSTTARWRLEIKFDGAVAGTVVVKAGEVELRKVDDPMKAVKNIPLAA